MGSISKNRKAALGKYDNEKSYNLSEAASIVKKITTTKFDASVDIAVRLGVDPKKSNQMVRGTVSLPHGTGKTISVLVLCTPDKEAEAKAAGADYVGLNEYIEKIKGGWTDVDVIITTPVSFEADKLADNAIELIQTIQKLKPSSAKGTYVKSIALSSTMSPGVQVEPKTVS